jgi:hypothetical protein
MNKGSVVNLAVTHAASDKTSYMLDDWGSVLGRKREFSLLCFV